MKLLRSRTIVSVCAIAAIAWVVSASGAIADMRSTNWVIESDSINSGGGEDETSASYGLRDTIGETGPGESTSASYGLHAGYRQMNEVSISISTPSDVTMSPLSLTQNTGTGSATWTVTTDNNAGYVLSLRASTTPALIAVSTGASFADYPGTVFGVPDTWHVTGSAYVFGLSGYGGAVSGYGSDTDCIAAANVPSNTLLWRGFSGSTPVTLASSTTRTATTGQDTTLCLGTEQHGVFAPSGTYRATVTATALPL